MVAAEWCWACEDVREFPESDLNTLIQDRSFADVVMSFCELSDTLGRNPTVSELLDASSKPGSQAAAARTPPATQGAVSTPLEDTGAPGRSLKKEIFVGLLELLNPAFHHVPLVDEDREGPDSDEEMDGSNQKEDAYCEAPADEVQGKIDGGESEWKQLKLFQECRSLVICASSDPNHPDD